MIQLQEPLGEVANVVRAREVLKRQALHTAVVEEEINAVVIRACLKVARSQLRELLTGHNTHLAGPQGIKHLLFNQRHLHKKGVMFTALIFSIIIADHLKIEFVWTSDC